MVIHEVNIVNNDVYFLEVVVDKIIINDNYCGIKVMNSNFELLKTLPLFGDIIIQCAYKKGNEILLYCLENECLVYINLELYSYRIISLKGYHDYYFSGWYQWAQDEVLLRAYDGRLIKVDLTEGLLYSVENDVPEWEYSFWGQYGIEKIFPVEKVVLVDETDGRLQLIDCRSGRTIRSEINKGSYHDFEIMDHYFAAIAEKSVCIWSDGKKEEYKPLNGYYFWRGRFINDKRGDYLILLSSKAANAECSRLEKVAI